jgi:hypothetical protein
LEALEIILGSIKEISCPKTDCPKKYVVLLIVVEGFSESKLQIKGAGLKLRLPLYFYRTTVIKIS